MFDRAPDFERRYLITSTKIPTIATKASVKITVRM
jgi:hypothetical protein